MATYELLESILTNGIRNTHYFNGRVLSAEDLKNDQDAIRRREEKYGQALGDGVVQGLMVSESADSRTDDPIVEITPGLAINRKGQVLALEQKGPVQLHLVRQQDQTDAAEGLFAPCEPPQPGVILTGEGFYILTISPAAGFEGRVPQYEDTAFGVTNIKCISKYEVEGVLFRLIAFDINNLEINPDTLTQINSLRLVSNSASLSKLQNMIAHAYSGTEKLRSFYENPLNKTENAQFALNNVGAPGKLRSDNILTDCDVPLALLYWTDAGIRFLDVWSARRLNILDASISALNYNLIYSTVEQFQSQLKTLTNLSSLEATSHFYYLPPFGRLPVRDVRYQSPNGINLRLFWGERYKGLPSIIEWQDVMGLMQTALNYPPRSLNDLTNVEIYYMSDNIKSIQDGETSQLFAFFTIQDIAERFCVPVRVVDPDGALMKTAFTTTIEGVIRTYSDFRTIFLLQLIPFEEQPTRQDLAGLHVIDQVIVVTKTILSGLITGCMNNYALWRSFDQLADAQRTFVDTWLYTVLPQGGGTRYPSELQVLIEQIESLLISVNVQGIRGLLPALADNDLFAANLAQTKINQTFSVTVGTGPQGAIALEYSMAPIPVVPGEIPLVEPGEYVLGFNLNAIIDREATFRLTPHIEASSWNAILWDAENNQPRANDLITIPQSNHIPGGISNDLFVRITVPAVGAGAASGLLVFEVTEVTGTGSVPPAHEEIFLERGEEFPVPDNRVTVSLLNVGGATLVGNALGIPRTGATGFQFNVRFTVAGEYELEIINADAPAITWEQLELSPNTFPVPGDPGSTTGIYNLPVAVLAEPGEDAENTDLLFTVRSTSSEINPPVSETFRLPVVILD